MNDEIPGLLRALERVFGEHEKLVKLINDANEAKETEAAEMHAKSLLEVDDIIVELKIEFDHALTEQKPLSKESSKIIDLINAKEFVSKLIVQCEDELDKIQDGQVCQTLRSRRDGLIQIFRIVGQEIMVLLNNKFRIDRTFTSTRR